MRVSAAFAGTAISAMADTIAADVSVFKIFICFLP
jgi:hypothetical protein